MLNDAEVALRAFLIATSEYVAAKYDLGWAVGSHGPQEPANRNVEETVAAFIAARAALEKAIS